MGAAAVAVAVVVGGVIIAVHSFSGHSEDQVAQLKAILNSVPLPAGTVLVDETTFAAAGDAPAYVQREYRLPSAGDPTAQLHAALTQGRFQFVDPHTLAVDPQVWSSATTSTGGEVYVLPPGRTGDGLDLTWQGSRLHMRIEPGEVR